MCRAIAGCEARRGVIVLVIVALLQSGGAEGQKGEGGGRAGSSYIKVSEVPGPRAYNPIEVRTGMLLGDREECFP